MLRLNNRTDLMVILTLILFIAGSAGAYDLEWSDPVSVTPASVGRISMNCSPEGIFHLVYTNLTTDSVHDAAIDGVNVTTTDIDYLDDPQMAPSSVDFLGTLPTVVFCDYYKNAIMTATLIAGQWGNPVGLPYTSGARTVKLQMGPSYYRMAYNWDDPDSGNSELMYVANPGAEWNAEIVSRLSTASTDNCYDMKVDSQGKACFVWWDQDHGTIKFARRNSEFDYETVVIDEDVVVCKFLEMEFIQVDIPVVSYVDATSPESPKIMFAYGLGTNWSPEVVHTAKPGAVLDLAVNNYDPFSTDNIYLILSDEDGYTVINRHNYVWTFAAIDGLAGENPANFLVADWDPVHGKLGMAAVIPPHNDLVFMSGVPAGYTPPPTPTPSTPTPTPTPWDCSEIGCAIDMPSDHYSSGDTFSCTVTVCNPSSDHYNGVPFFVVLDVYGQYFFAPSFSDFDYYTMDLNPGSANMQIIPPFTWPEDVGSASGIWFYAAMTTADISRLFGAMDSFEFGWSS